MKDLPIGRIVEESPDSAVIEIGGELRRLPVLGTVGDGGTITWKKDVVKPESTTPRCPWCGNTTFGYSHARIGTFNAETGEIQREGNDRPILYCDRCNDPADPFPQTAPKEVVDAYKQAFEEQERRHVD